jgi:hypothetical protein
MQRRSERKRQIDVTCPQRRIRGRAGQRVKTMEPMGPASDDDEMTEPRPKRIDEPRECSGVLHLTRHD